MLPRTFFQSNNPQDKLFCEPGLRDLSTAGASLSIISLTILIGCVIAAQKMK